MYLHIDHIRKVGHSTSELSKLIGHHRNVKFAVEYVA